MDADEDIDSPGITLTEGQPVDNCACKFLWYGIGIARILCIAICPGAYVYEFR